MEGKVKQRDRERSFCIPAALRRLTLLKDSNINRQ